MNIKLCLQSFGLTLLLIAGNAYALYYSDGNGSVVTGYSTTGGFGNTYVTGYGPTYGVDSYGNAYVTGPGTTYGTDSFGNTYVTGSGNTYGVDSFGNPYVTGTGNIYRGNTYVDEYMTGYRQAGIYGNPENWNRSNYYGTYPTTNSYSCTNIPGYFDGVGNWVQARRICTGT